MIETLPAGATRAEVPIGLCVVVDARTGRVLTAWRGHAARGASRAPGARAAQVSKNRIILLRDARRPSVDPPVNQDLQKGRPYAAFDSLVPAFTLASWETAPFVFSINRTTGPVFQPELDAAIRNTRDVVAHMCFTRHFCSHDGRSDDRWENIPVTGDANTNRSFYDPFSKRVFLTSLNGYQNDLIAHEFGHHVDQTFSGDDKVLDREVQEVREGIADMFAVDFDREDATMGEDGPAGKNTLPSVENWALGGRVGSRSACRNTCAMSPTSIQRDDPRPRLLQLPQKVTPDVAGRVLYQLVTDLGKEARYVTVANAFVNKATSMYAQNPKVAADTRQAFLVDGGMDHGPAPCSPAAPPSPPAPVPTPAPPTQVAVPNVRGDLPGAANSALSAVGLRLGSLTDVTDNTCSHIGTIVSQVPSAGTLVAPGVAVNVTIGQLPPNPCP